MVMAEQLQSQPRRSPIQVGFYDIIRTIGKGNFASVKLARHRVTKTEVAIKIIEKTRLDQSNWKKIYREIQILKLLRHPHIIKLYEVIETKSTIYLVCEYASHGEVFDYITQEEKIPEEKARKMFYQVLTAIEHCHKNNVVHRDLKAENLLLDANDNVKLADFGFGNFFQSGQNLNTWCGSPPYAAPEVFEGKLYEGPQLDIWSLGIVLYVLVCGTFPFDGSNLATLKDRVLAGRFRIPFWMSRDCENLIRRMLVVNPKKRLTIAQIKKHKWMQFFAKPEVLRKCDSPVRQAGHNQLPEFNEHILKLIQSLGIKRQETIESLRNSAYDHRYAIYHLLVDRLKHHRTSVPLETRFSYDAGKRRPSSIVEQCLAKHSLLNSPMPAPQETSRLMHKNQFFSPQQNLSAMIIDESMTSTPRDDVATLDVNHLNDVQFSDEAAHDLPKIQRSLAFNALHTPVVLQPPVSPSHISKPRFINQPTRGTLPHQPWSFNAGTGVSGFHYNRLPNSPLKVSPYNGSGDVPSVTSIDEGVELSSASPSEQEMILRQANQQRRHTSLGIPDMSFIPFMSLASGRGEPLSQSPVHYGASQADSLFGTISNATGYEQDSFTGSSEISCDVNAMQGQPCDVTPRLVVSPCLDENVNLPPQQDTRTVYMEDQRQLLDVSPTGFREGRRASDGLLLLGDNRIGEDLKRLTRTSGISTINQDETDDNCFDLSERDSEHHPNLFHKLAVEDRNNELGTMTSHSFQHAVHAPRSDGINFQPYIPTSRRRSLQVSQLPDGYGGSYSKGMENPAFVQQAASNRLKVLNMAQDPSDESNHYQWSSWKAVTDNNSSTSGYVNAQQRRDTIPLLIRTQPSAFAVASDESMTKSPSPEQAKRQPSLPNTIHSGVHQVMGQQSLVQVLQQRRLSRRLKAAQNTLQQVSAYSSPLPELEQLKINVESNFNVAAYNALGFSTTDSSEELSSRPFAQGLMQQYNTSVVARGDSPELQHSFPAEPNELFQPNGTFDQQSLNAFARNTSLPSWSDNSETGQFQSTNNVMEYLSS